MSSLIDDDGLDNRFSLLSYGAHEALVAIKIAQKFETANVVTLVPSRETFSQQKQLVESLHIKNLVLLAAEMNPSQVATLHALPDMFRYQLLGLEVYQHFLAPGFLMYLGRLLSLAQTTFLEVVDPAQLELANFLLRSTNKRRFESNFFRGLIATALDAAGVSEFALELLPVASGKSRKVHK